MTSKQSTFFLANSSMDASSSDNEADGAPRPPRRNARRRSSLQYEGVPQSPLSPRAPPSSFAYPFQAYPGNPDPLPTRRASLESLANAPRKSLNFSDDSHFPASRPTSDIGSSAHEELGRPVAPFMSDSGHGPSSSSQNPLYRNSAAATLTPKGSTHNLNESSRTNSMVFRTPFLSPSSRTSSIWTPPAYPVPLGANGASPAASTTALGLSARKGE